MSTTSELPKMSKSFIVLVPSRLRLSPQARREKAKVERPLTWDERFSTRAPGMGRAFAPLQLSRSTLGHSLRLAILAKQADIGVLEVLRMAVAN
jgi:hypothetical protein